MKRRLTPVLTVTIGLILVSGLAYAAKKKGQAKEAVETSVISEEDALKAELLETTGEQQKKMPAIDDANKNASEEVKGRIIAKQPKQ
jgi:hypothetical protein